MCTHHLWIMFLIIIDRFEVMDEWMKYIQENNVVVEVFSVCAVSIAVLSCCLARSCWSLILLSSSVFLSCCLAPFNLCLHVVDEVLFPRFKSLYISLQNCTQLAICSHRNSNSPIIERYIQIIYHYIIVRTVIRLYLEGMQRYAEFFHDVFSA